MRNIQQYRELNAEYYALWEVYEQIHALVKAQDCKERTSEVAHHALGLLAAEKILLKALFDKNSQMREIVHANA